MRQGLQLGVGLAFELMPRVAARLVTDHEAHRPLHHLVRLGQPSLLARMLAARLSSSWATRPRRVRRYGPTRFSRPTATRGWSGPRAFSRIASTR